MATGTVLTSLPSAPAPNPANNAGSGRTVSINTAAPEGVSPDRVSPNGTAVGAAPSEPVPDIVFRGQLAEDSIGVQGQEERDEPPGREDSPDSPFVDPGEDRDSGQGLSDEELAEVRELRARDQEVRQHETAHQVVGGRYAGAPRYEFERGPDGTLYAVEGSVPIDVAPIPGDPEATIEKMRVVRAAALAPAQPSTADFRIAMVAMQQMLEAQTELRQERLESLGDILSRNPENSQSLGQYQMVAEMGRPGLAADERFAARA